MAETPDYAYHAVRLLPAAARVILTVLYRHVTLRDLALVDLSAETELQLRARFEGWIADVPPVSIAPPLRRRA